ncbi:hypothetical protein EK904_006949 [Melospiza melodia maxima]|nr:hypothetical protein EK904_006949 [Melospiza melodia maxima]
MQFFTPVPMNRAVFYPNEEHSWFIDIELFFLDQNSPPVLDNQIGMDSERLAVSFQISQKRQSLKCSAKTAWKFPVVPELMQAAEEFCLERNVAPFVPSAFSSWPSKARFADAGPVPGPVASVSGTTTLQ